MTSFSLHTDQPETAMLRITNDLLLVADGGQVRFIVLLDLSAAFDTIDHHILLQKLSSRLHLSKSAVHWFASYLDDWYQKVVIGDETSSDFQTAIRSSARVCYWTLVIVHFFLAHRRENIHVATGSLHS